MKKLAIILALAMICSVGYAQRPGGSPSRGGSHPSMSTSRSSVSHSSPSRSSVSHSSSSRSTYTPAQRSSHSTSTFTPSRSSVSRPSASRPTNSSSISTRPSQTRETPSNRISSSDWNSRPRNSVGTPNGRFNGQQGPNGGAPNPGMNPGQRPPVPHGMHPHPPMYHPMHHHYIGMHYCLLDHWIYEDLYWHGYYNYVRTYPYNEVVVYVNSNQSNTELIAVATDDNYVYSLYRDSYENEVYFTITDNTDKVVAKTPVNRKYCKLLIGDGGVWVFKNKDRDPLFFMYTGGQLYKYEQD